jgi:peptidoglycan-associated lipoprotein
MQTTFRGIVLALVAAFSLSACRRTPETVATPVDTPPPAETCDAACMRARADSIAAARRADSIAAVERDRAAMAARIEAARNTLTATIYFDYDQSDIRGDARSALDSKLPILRSSAAVQLRIAGHADERGSDQYNDALGQRRAASAKRYLTDNGIDGSRITIVSYGETRPATMGSDESAWARNRRAEFEITAGGNNITPPQ